jgi:hypothetical protein
MASDVLYFLTFAAGMAAFWLSGHASVIALQAVKNVGLHSILGLIVTGGVYGLGMFLLGLAVLRRVNKGLVIATVMTIILGYAAAQIIVRLAASHIHTTTGVGLLTFVLYLCYGAIYVASLAAGRRFAK